MMIAPAAMRRQGLKSTSRVTDENLAPGGGAVARSQSRWKHGVSFVCEILLAPLSMLSCLSHPYMSSAAAAADGVWVSAELPHTSEVTHLMVRDSLRYAILM